MYEIVLKFILDERFDWKYANALTLLSTLSNPGVHTLSDRNEYQRISLRVKCGRRV
jgi:hypothetical protein